MTGQTSWKEPLPMLTEALIATYLESNGLHHLDLRPLPNRDIVESILQDLFDVLFPGFGRRQDLHRRNIEYYIGDLLDMLLDKLSQQIRRALRHIIRRASLPLTSKPWPRPRRSSF